MPNFWIEILQRGLIHHVLYMNTIRICVHTLIFITYFTICRTFKGKYSWCLKEYLSQQKEFDVVAASFEEDYHGYFCVNVCRYVIISTDYYQDVEQS